MVGRGAISKQHAAAMIRSAEGTRTAPDEASAATRRDEVAPSAAEVPQPSSEAGSGAAESHGRDAAVDRVESHPPADATQPGPRYDSLIAYPAAAQDAPPQDTP